MACVDIELPWPPSANHAWRPTPRGGKILSDDHKRYRKAVGDSILVQRIRRHWTTSALAVGLLCNPPNARSFDIDNRVKTTLDALVSAGVIEDDKYIDLIVIARGKPRPPDGTMLVHISELDTMPDRLRDMLAGIVPNVAPPSKQMTRH